jgi:AcrR family transcriptional regulator
VSQGTRSRWRGEPLPRGRHNLSTEEVRASQRERLLAAMLQCVGEDGYAATTVPKVIATARVSRNGFYALFDDKVDCFLALCDEMAAVLLDELYAFGAEPNWKRALEEGMLAYLRFWQERTEFSRSYLVELPSAGPRAWAQRDNQFKRFEPIFDQLAASARKADPSLPPVHRMGSRLLVLGITEIVALEVREGRVHRLEALHEELLALAIGIVAAR